MSNNPLEAYQSIEQTTLSGRELEASVLTKAAMRLMEVKQNWDRGDHEQMLDDALRYNQRIWTFFQAELMDETNPMPDEVKQNLLKLATFIDRRTFTILAYPTAEKLDILISINQNIAAGLRGNPGGEMAQP